MTATQSWVTDCGLDPSLAAIDKPFPTGHGWYYPFGAQCGAPTKTGRACQRTLSPGQVRCYRHREMT